MKFDICGAFRNGFSLQDVIAATKHDNPALSWYGAGYVVGVATRTLY
ncbi:DUF732 domain-containing protein [Mycolicibacterium sp. BiH015]|nr:DUF732 domain-containing protein [Mycolicibacterium sp. BiH015]MDA2889876.1 DUF732 domain-containing protein [Mycolicibacterium sp. BiH015]